MILTVGDWKLDVDIPQNMTISAEQAADHCVCGYCRNFYNTVDSVYPNLRPFLARFGLNIEGPDEFCPFEPTICEATYIVNGSVLRIGTQNIRVDDIPVTISENIDFDTERKRPFFAIRVGLMELPWILDEPMNEVVSPANDPDCLERMWKKLLQRSQETQYS